VRQQKRERVAEANLGERVFKREVGLGAARGAKEEAQEDEPQAAPDGVQQLLAEGLPLASAAGDGIRKRHAHQKTEPRLNGVVQAHSRPFDVRLVVGQDAPERAVGEGLPHLPEVHHLAHHEQHDQSAVGVYGDIARRSGVCGLPCLNFVKRLWAYRGLHGVSLRAGGTSSGISWEAHPFVSRGCRRTLAQGESRKPQNSGEIHLARGSRRRREGRLTQVKRCSRLGTNQTRLLWVKSARNDLSELYPTASLAQRI